MGMTFECEMGQRHPQKLIQKGFELINFNGAIDIPYGCTLHTD